MPLKHVLFDFGGVLVRTTSQEPRTRLESTYGLAPGEASEIVFGGASGHAVQMGWITDVAHWEEIRLRIGLSPDEIATFRTQFFAADRVDHELVAYIDRLRRQHTIGLLSNASSAIREILENPYHLTQHFDQITISAEEGVMKPDRRIFQIALQRAGVAPEETVFVDDMPENVEGARQLGIAAIRFLNTPDLHAEIARLTGVD